MEKSSSHTSTGKRFFEADAGESSKRARIRVEAALSYDATDAIDKTPFSHSGRNFCILPSSRSLIGSRLHEDSHIVESDVGITEYISRDLQPIHGTIKQR